MGLAKAVVAWVRHHWKWLWWLLIAPYKILESWALDVIRSRLDRGTFESVLNWIPWITWALLGLAIIVTLIRAGRRSPQAVPPSAPTPGEPPSPSYPLPEMASFPPLPDTGEELPDPPPMKLSKETEKFLFGPSVYPPGTTWTEVPPPEPARIEALKRARRVIYHLRQLLDAPVLPPLEAIRKPQQMAIWKLQHEQAQLGRYMNKLNVHVVRAVDALRPYASVEELDRLYRSPRNTGDLRMILSLLDVAVDAATPKLAEPILPTTQQEPTVKDRLPELSKLIREGQSLLARVLSREPLEGEKQLRRAVRAWTDETEELVDYFGAEYQERLTKSLTAAKSPPEVHGSRPHEVLWYVLSQRVARLKEFRGEIKRGNA